MNREIKFRVNDGFHNGNFEVKSIDFKNKLVTIDCGADCKFNLNEIKLMQFTGLKDKNNKEIYENDIISWGGKPCEIKFTDGCFTYEQELIKGNESLQYSEIIGNIYENPELIS